MKNTQPHKIDIVVKYFYPVTAGIETNIMETYRFLVENGWDVTLHTSKDTYGEKDSLPDNDLIKGIKVKRYSFGPLGYWPNIDWDTAEIVCLHNFDMFPHMQILIYSLMRKLLGKKKYALFVTPHGGYNPEWSIYSKVQEIIKKSYNYTLGTFLMNFAADGVRAVSHWEKNEMTLHLVKDTQVDVITNGIENEAYENIDKEASADIKKTVKSLGRYILQIGRIYGIKNYETTIRALPQIDKDITFVILGPIADQKYYESIQKLAKECGVEDRVKFLGVIRGIDKYYLIRHAQLMVHMAIWESFCNAVHEGMSQGLVCIVANNTALPFLIKDKVNGYCVETHNSNLLADKIMHVIHNENTPAIKEMKARNKEFGLKHSWRGVSEMMDSFYRRTYSKI